MMIRGLVATQPIIHTATLTTIIRTSQMVGEITLTVRKKPNLTMHNLSNSQSHRTSHISLRILNSISSTNSKS